MRARRVCWSPAEAAASLVRLAFVERSVAHLLAGWAAKTPAFEAKLLFGAQMHRSMERATVLKSRLTGLCHAVGEEAPVRSGLRDALAHVDRAPSPSHLIAGIFGWIYPRLIELYEAHLRGADPDGDRASVEVIGATLPALKAESREGLKLADRRAELKPWLRELDALWAHRAAGDPLALERAVWAPVDRAPHAARPEGSRFGKAGSLGVFPVDPLNDPQDIGMFLHKELDEEFTTLELMARNSYEHPEMAWAFHRDMLRQASDEARHAALITRVLEARGFRHGDFPVSTSSYDGIYAFEPCEAGSRQELLWRLLIRQTFMEGLAIDHLGYEIERRRGAGQADIAHVFEYILRDEVFHAASGLRWSRELLGADPKAVLKARAQALAYFTERAEAAREAFVLEDLDAALGELATIEAGKALRGGKLPERPLNRAGRKQAGFTDEDIAQVLAWGYATEG